MNRYFAARFDEDGQFYVFDSADQGNEACGPFDSWEDAEQTANDLNTDNGVADGLRPHMIQTRLS